MAELLTQSKFFKMLFKKIYFFLVLITTRAGVIQTTVIFDTVFASYESNINDACKNHI